MWQKIHHMFSTVTYVNIAYAYLYTMYMITIYWAMSYMKYLFISLHIILYLYNSHSDFP